MSIWHLDLRDLIALAKFCRDMWVGTNEKGDPAMDRAKRAFDHGDAFLIERDMRNFKAGKKYVE